MQKHISLNRSTLEEFLSDSNPLILASTILLTPSSINTFRRSLRSPWRRPAYTFDPDAGAIYFRLGHGKVKKTIEVVLKALFDIDEGGRVVGIEVLPTNSEILEGMRRIIQATSL
ncbi:MAG: hypothetical protein B6U65_00600 [Candidatus Wolframiiraptor sp. EX4484-121]|nr:MAG: hypothetical protein B6U65_00600 [Candidatus Wolframiiraptor sp. EX4484-121]